MGWRGLSEAFMAFLAETPAATDIGGKATPDLVLWPHLIKVMATMAAMLGVLILVLYLYKRYGPAHQRASPLIQVLGTHYLSPKKALILVGIGSERILLASTADHLTFLTALSPSTPNPTATVHNTDPGLPHEGQSHLDTTPQSKTSLPEAAGQAPGGFGVPLSEAKL